MKDVSGTMWRKSSRSADQGGTCVEVAPAWRTSSRSGEQGGDCVQVAVIGDVRGTLTVLQHGQGHPHNPAAAR